MEVIRPSYPAARYKMKCQLLHRRLAQLVRDNPVVAFPVLYLGWAYLFWTPVVLSQRIVWGFPSILWFLVGGASPFLAGILLAALDGGSRQVLDILRRLLDWRRICGKSWMLLLSFWLLFDLAMAGLGILLGVTPSPLNPDWGLFREPRALLFLALLSFVFPAVEEIGLRGYYLEALQRKWTPTAAGIVNGIVWAMWHAPFVLFAGYYANTTFNPALSWWLPMIVCHALLITYVYNHNNRSLLAVLVFHAMMNFTGEWLRISPEMYPFMLTGTLLIAAVVVWRLRAETA